MTSTPCILDGATRIPLITRHPPAPQAPAPLPRTHRSVTIGAATLYLGEANDILPHIQQVHAVVTDPPYGLGKQPDALAMLRDSEYFEIACKRIAAAQELSL